MTFSKTVEKILDSPGKRILRREWPDQLSIPAEETGGMMGFGSKNVFWEKVRTLRKYTDSMADKFSESHQGSTGWEYEMMMVYVNNRFYYSSPSTSKDYNQVNAKHRLKFETVTDQKTKEVRDRIFIGDKQIGTQYFSKPEDIEKRNAAIHNGSYYADFVCHFHSHPQIQIPNHKQRVYTFFSPQDMSSFVNNTFPLMGLVTDKLWLLGRTQEFTNMMSQNMLVNMGAELGEVTRTELLGEKAMINVAGEVLSKYELAAYVGKFGGRLERIS